MKVILSRKGMDSMSGGMASPILPDGTLLSLPIPDNTSNLQYKAVFYRGQSLQEIIHQLKPGFDFTKNAACHLDPDVYDEIQPKPAGWKPAFGQWGIPAEHLDKLKVDIGDIFLFYGMFKQTVQRPDGTLHFVKGAPIQHIMYGYMCIGEIEKLNQKYPWHPHNQNTKHENNRLYLPDEYATFHYDESLVLTQRGQKKRSLWQLPSFFAENDIEISWQGKNKPVLNNGFAVLNSVARGQEFVITAHTKKQEQNLYNWVESLIHIGTKPAEVCKMKPIITEIHNNDLKKGVFTNTQFIFFAESGAMGEPGSVMLITAGGSIFHCNYCFGDVSLNKLCRCIPVLKECNFNVLEDTIRISDEWKHEYLGAGNHLLIRNDIYDRFKEAISDAEYPEDIYLLWFDAAWDIIEKQNSSKLLFDMKTPEELLLLANKAILDSVPMTDEEEVEYDSSYGYDI